MLTARTTKMVKMERSPRSFCKGLCFICRCLLFPIMLADSGSLCNDPDGDQVEVPEPAEVACPGYGDIKRRSDLDLVGGDRTVHVPGEFLYPVHLSGEKRKKGVRIAIDTAVQLDLLGKLVSTMIHFLLDGNDMEHVQDQCDQDDGHQNIDKAADVGGLAFFRLDQP